MEQFWRSRYTLAQNLESGDGGILLNTFSGAVDYVSSDVIEAVKGARGRLLDQNREDDAALISHGYYVRSLEHEDAAARYIGTRAKAKAVESDVAKYMFGLTLRCNLACSYCWQVQEFKSARQKTSIMSDDLVDAAFRYIVTDMRESAKTRGVVSLFGGEPLIDRPQFHNLVDRIGSRAMEQGLGVHFTTNGRSLHKFLDELERYKPSIQVTVDGAQVRDGKLTLMRANQPLPGLLELMLEIAERGLTSGAFLRFLAEERTIPEFIALSDDIYARGQLSGLPFSLGVAPLQNKSAESSEYVAKHLILSSLLTVLAARDYAHHIEFVDWRSLNLLQNLRQGSETLPLPAFYHCEANTDLTCFDQDGYVYACYEAMGDHDMSVGQYWPDVRIDQKHLAEYRGRSAFTMEQCTECPVSPICGGGCEVRGHKHNGAYNLPYCDDLHEETAYLMKNWGTIVNLMTGDARC